MGRAERFEDLVAWQKARLLSKQIYELTRKEPIARDRDLVRQIRRAVVSVMSNIAEGFERTGAGEFHHFLSIAKGSCGEVRTQLYVALDAQYLDDATFKSTLEQAEEVGRIIGGLRAAVQHKRDQQRGK